MNCFYLLVICILYPSVLGIQLSFREILAFKCNQTNVPEYVQENIQAALKHFDETIQSLITESGSYKKNYHKLCTIAAHEELYPTVEEIAGKLSVCLTTEELYLGKFLVETFTYAEEQFCKGGDLDLLLELNEFLDTNTCLYGARDLENLCVENTTLYKNLEAENFVLVKDDLCSDVQFMRDCIKTIVPCKKILTALINLVSEPFSKWCNSQ